jgi:hypothetical protein
MPRRPLTIHELRSTPEQRAAQLAWARRYYQQHIAPIDKLWGECERKVKERMMETKERPLAERVAELETIVQSILRREAEDIVAQHEQQSAPEGEQQVMKAEAFDWMERCRRDALRERDRYRAMCMKANARLIALGEPPVANPDGTAQPAPPSIDRLRALVDGIIEQQMMQERKTSAEYRPYSVALLDRVMQSIDAAFDAYEKGELR